MYPNARGRGLSSPAKADEALTGACVARPHPDGTRGWDHASLRATTHKCFEPHAPLHTCTHTHVHAGTHATAHTVLQCYVDSAARQVSDRATAKGESPDIVSNFCGNFFAYVTGAQVPNIYVPRSGLHHGLKAGLA